MCPVWNHRDLAGREVCTDSFYTKRAGCNSSLDRINVENDLRPQYMEYITLDACGINGDMYGCPELQVGVTESHMGKHGNHKHNMGSSVRHHIKEGWAPTVPGYPPYKGPYDDAIIGCNSLNEIPKHTGQFGAGNFRADIQPTCNNYSYEQAMAEISQSNRQGAMVNTGARYQALRSAGMGY